MKTFLWLLCLQITFASTSFASALIPINEQYDTDVNVTKTPPVRKLRKENPCVDARYRYNFENDQDAGTADWYAEAVEKLREEYGAKAFSEEGEIKLFARRYWNGDDFCNSDGCHGPDCERIWEHVSNDESIEDPKETTRKVFFALKRISNLNRIFRLVNKMLILSQVNLVGDLFSIIVDFTPQTDLYAEKKCALMRSALSSIISSVLGIASMGVSIGVKEAVDVIARTKEIVEITRVIIDEAIRDSKLAGETLESNKGVDYWKRPSSEEPVSSETLTQFQTTFGNTDCFSAGYGRKEENFERVGQLGRFLAGKFMLKRIENNKLLNELNDGTGSGTTTMAAWMKRAFIPDSNVQSRKAEEGLETRITENLRHATISSALATSKCYVKCNRQAGAWKECPWQYRGKTTDSNLRHYRICTGDEDDAFGDVCQAECWTSDDKSHETELYGLAKLPDFGINPLDLIKNSVRLYDKYHNALSPETFDLASTFSSEEKTYFLPVCRSNYITISDITKEKYQKHFPIPCGDYAANETATFLQRIWMVKGSINGEIDSGKAKYVYENIIPWISREYSPVLQESIWCAFDGRWPVEGDEKEIQVDRKSRYCGALKAGVLGKTEAEANDWFCNQDTTMEMWRNSETKKIKKNMDSRTRKSPSYYCARFNQKHSSSKNKNGNYLSEEVAVPPFNYTELYFADRMDFTGFPYDIFDVRGTQTYERLD